MRLTMRNAILAAASATATSGTILSENNNFYITPDMHHGVRVKAAIQQFDTTLTGRFVNFVVNASASDDQDELIVEQGYGQLQVLRIRP